MRFSIDIQIPDDEVLRVISPFVRSMEQKTASKPKNGRSATSDAPLSKAEKIIMQVMHQHDSAVKGIGGIVRWRDLRNAMKKAKVAPSQYAVNKLCRQRLIRKIGLGRYQLSAT